MEDWVPLVIVLAITLPLLAAAVLVDRRQRRKLEGNTEEAPERGDATVDSHLPSYITQSEIDDLPLPSAGTKSPDARPGTKFGFGHAGPEFATSGDVAAQEHARVLMVDGEISSIRELLALLSGVTSEDPLVIVATDITDDVLATLRANRRALGLPIVAAICPRKELYELRTLIGGEVLDVADLKSGYTPTSSFGRAGTWHSSPTRTWVDPEAGPQTLK